MIPYVDPRASTPAPALLESSIVERIESAHHALDGLDATMRALPNGPELSAAVLRREAVTAAVLDGWTLTLRDFLLHDDGHSAGGALASHSAPGPGSAVACAGRYLDILEHGNQPVEGESAAGDCILLDLLRRLLCEQEQRCLVLIAPGVRAIAHRALANTNAGSVTLERCPDAAEHCAAADLADAVTRAVADANAFLARVATLTTANETRIGSFSQAAHSARRVHLALQRDPLITLPRLLQQTGLRVQAATSALHRLRALGIVREITGRQRHRVYGYEAYLALLGENLARDRESLGGTLSWRPPV